VAWAIKIKEDSCGIGIIRVSVASTYLGGKKMSSS